uniref:Elongin-C n=1 Tax=Steinernema glaseri TaxID=37863 RepID=A0A1I7Z334_9BILA
MLPRFNIKFASGAVIRGGEMFFPETFPDDAEEEMVHLVGVDGSVELRRCAAELSPTFKCMLYGRTYQGFCTDDEPDDGVTRLYLRISCSHLNHVRDYLNYKYEFLRDVNNPPPDYEIPSDYRIPLMIIADFLDC